jgi:hypothetical protein
VQYLVGTELSTPVRYRERGDTRILCPSIKESRSDRRDWRGLFCCGRRCGATCRASVRPTTLTDLCSALAPVNRWTAREFCASSKRPPNAQPISDSHWPTSYLQDNLQRRVRLLGPDPDLITEADGAFDVLLNTITQEQAAARIAGPSRSAAIGAHRLGGFALARELILGCIR